MKRIALVTGGNRGIGFEICRRLGRDAACHVLVSSRGREAGEEARDRLAREGLEVSWCRLDVSSPDHIRALREDVVSRHGGLDILVNNAGVSFNGFDAEIARATIDTNFFGALHLTDALLPLMRKGGRIVMVSSGMGDRSILGDSLKQRFHDPAMTRDELVALMSQFVAAVAGGRHGDEGWPSSAYCVSKIGMTKLAEILAKEIERGGNPGELLVNAACPGWVRTEMGGSRADRSVEVGADTPVWLALLPPGGPQGGFFRDRAPAEW